MSGRATENASSGRSLRQRKRQSYAETPIEISDDEVASEESDNGSVFADEEMDIEESSGSGEEMVSEDDDSDSTPETDLPLPNSKSRTKTSKRISKGNLDDEDAESDVESMDEDGAPIKASKRKQEQLPLLVEIGAGNRKGIDENAPPMTDIKEIFKDIMKKALKMGFGNCLDELQRRSLNVATLCSGTESPILALNMINEGKRSLCRTE